MAVNPQQQVNTAVARLNAGDATAQQNLYGKPNATFQQQAQPQGDNPFKNAFMTGLSVLSRGAQLVPRYLDELRQEGNASAQNSAAYSPQRLIDYIGAQPRAVAHALGGLTDLTGKNDVTFNQAITGQQSTSPLAKTGDLLASIVTDPTTYMGFGLVGDAGKVAKAALGLEHGTQAAADLTKVGTAGLSAEKAGQVADVIAQGAKSPLLRGDEGLGKLLRQATGRGVRSGAEKFAQDATKQLAQPEGLQFAGRTILKKSLLTNAAKAAGLSKAAGAVGDTRAVQEARKAVTPRLEITQNLGNVAEGAANTARTRADALAATLNAADTGHIQAALKPATLAERVLGGGTVSDLASRQISDALDTGQIPNVIAHFTDTGQHTAARLAQALDNVRKSSSARYVEAGLAHEGQLHDINTYAQRVPSAAGARYLAKNESQARSMLGFVPSGEQIATPLKNAAPQFRKLPDMPISQLNQFLERKTGVKDFMEPDPVKRVLGRATQINSQIGHAERMRQLAETTINGKPLAVLSDKVQVAQSAMQDLSKNYNKARNAINGELDKAVHAKIGDRELARGLSGGIRELDNSARRMTSAVERVTTTLEKLHSMQIGLGTAVRAAAAGTRVDAGFVQGARDAFTEARGVLEDLQKIPSVNKDEVKAAESALKNAKSLLSDVNAGERARTGAAGAKAARMKALASASATLERTLRHMEVSQNKELNKVEKSIHKLTQRIPDATSRAKVAELRQQKSALHASYREQAKTIKASGKLAVPKGYVKVDAGPLGTFNAPAEIAHDVETTYKMFDREQDLKVFAKSAEALGAAWRNLALNVVGLGVGTLNRNAATDIMMMMVRGDFKDFSKYKSGGKMMKSIMDAEKAGQNVSNYVKTDKTLTPWERRVAAAAVHEGIATTGLYNTDVVAKGIAATRKAQLGRAVNLANRGNIATRHLGHAEEVMANLNRVTLFADKIAKGGNPAVAARSVRETLIDYTDLTKQEKTFKRYIMPFYTFAARNLTNMTWSVIHAPGRTLTTEKVREAIFGQDNPTGPVPDYALQNDQRPFLNVGGVPILSNMQSPLQAAGQQIQPLADLASTLPGMPHTEGGAQAAAAGALQNIGGFEGSLAKNAAQEATGTNLFTGAPLTPTQSPWERLAMSLVPSAQKGVSAGTDLSGGDQAKQTARALSLLGITSTANDKKTQQSEVYRRIRELGKAADEQGLPTATALRKQGKIAPAPRTKSKSKAKK